MCTAVIAYKVHPNYPLILLSNRDEFYNRPTKDAGFWERAPQILSGIDLEKGGTWLGITRTGYLSLLTNYRDFSKHVEEPLSRGLLTKNYLENPIPFAEYAAGLSASSQQYNPYNIIFGSFDDLGYYSNISDKPISLEPGIYGLSNGLLNDPWPKVSTAMEALRVYIELVNPDDTLDEETLFSILSSPVTYPLELLPKTGISEALEIDLSSIFIELDTYGTRMQTLLYVDNLRNVTFTERARQNEQEWSEHRFAFRCWR
ncbi:NRDE family protein [Fusibacter paucivorans]|uniref:NRDE family protein n=1 Tax=Fusibacter paucivorans TaxID=76009 RepID=UPI001FE6F765|nr:NRDE family protein [Fusibacter paucivorans]